MADASTFTITRSMSYPHVGRRTLRRTFKTSEGAVKWLNRDIAEKARNRCPTTNALPGSPHWILRAGNREVLRVDHYGYDHGPWA